MIKLKDLDQIFRIVVGSLICLFGTALTFVTIARAPRDYGPFVLVIACVWAGGALLYFTSCLRAKAVSFWLKLLPGLLVVATGVQVARYVYRLLVLAN